MILSRLFSLTAPATTQSRIFFAFSKTLALIYLIAFYSLLTQVDALFGERGIVPIIDILTNIQGQVSWFQLPHLFFSTQPSILYVVLGLGIIASIALFFGLIPLLSSSICFFAYLSFVNLGRVFMSFQWDVLLLEIGFLMMLASPAVLRWRRDQHYAPSKLSILAFQFLLFRLMLASGLVKLFSGEASWRDLTALQYHYWSQPMPHFLSYFADKLPVFIQKLSVLLMFVIELLLPFFIFLSTRFKTIAASGFILLMGLILLTGNYNFFNLLVIALSLLLLEDKQLFKHSSDDESQLNNPLFLRRFSTACLTVILFFGLSVDLARFVPSPSFQQFSYQLYKPFAPFKVLNSYGLFARMTKIRNEISIWASMDGETWKPYTFKYKANDAFDRPKWISPHQARLEWQLWFAALKPYTARSWLNRFALRLLEHDSPVLELLESSPFEQTPKQIQFRRQAYRFSSFDKLSDYGKWWDVGDYYNHSPIFSSQ